MPRQIRILDIKTGYAREDYKHQLLGYSYLLLKRYPDAESVYAAILWVRDESLEPFQWTRQEVMNWYVRLVERLNDTTYRPGRQCAHCPRRANCEGSASMLRRSLVLVSQNSFDRLPVEPEARAAALEEILVAARLVSRATEDAEELIRAEVAANGGQLGNLRITAEERRGIVMDKAWPILNEELADDLTPVLKIGVGDLKKLVGDRAPYRGKGKAIEAMFARLDEAGAIKTNTIEKLEIVKQAAKEITCETV